MTQHYRVLDLFSGIGAFSLGLQRAGMTPIAFCEIDPFCRDVLARHWPGVPILHDVRATEFLVADIVCGGFPCQDVSRAGKRAGITGERSGLYRELVRAIRMVRPRHAIVENVAALLGDGMGDVLGDLAEGRACVEWDCVPAQALGAPHERDRVWIVAHAPRDGCGQRGSRRPPDSFARVRNATRRHASNAPGEGLEGWSESKASRKSLAVAAGGDRNPWRPWTDEPELSGVDDGAADWVDRTRATGNALIPQIPELIGRAIIEAEQAP